MKKRGGEGGECHDFSQKCFCLTVPNHFLEETFCVSESFGYRKCLCLRRDYPRFSMESLLSPVPKNFVEEPICVSQNFLYRKILGIRGGGDGVRVTICRQNCFCLTVPSHFLEDIFCVSESFGYRKGLCLRWDYPPFSTEFSMSQSTEKLRRGTHLCFTEFFVSKEFMKRRGEGRECHDFSQKCFCLTVPNHFLEETFCVSESFGYRKCLCLRGDYPRFSMGSLLSPVPRNFVEEPICVSQKIL